MSPLPPLPSVRALPLLLLLAGPGAAAPPCLDGSPCANGGRCTQLPSREAACL
ncbi:Neurogenic locus notch like protein 3 [Pteropus alecto]|nr:Neurogenic locus notch like protein 3 [Pteropus alecto]